jgi:hypothetical protein
MCSRGMFVHRPCRLGAAVAILTAELSCGDQVLAEWALERRKAIHHLDAVMSHIFNCSLVSGQPRALLGTKVTPATLIDLPLPSHLTYGHSMLGQTISHYRIDGFANVKT